MDGFNVLIAKNGLKMMTWRFVRETGVRPYVKNVTIILFVHIVEDLNALIASMVGVVLIQTVLLQFVMSVCILVGDTCAHN